MKNDIKTLLCPGFGSCASFSCALSGWFALFWVNCTLLGPMTIVWVAFAQLWAILFCSRAICLVFGPIYLLLSQIAWFSGEFVYIWATLPRCGLIRTVCGWFVLHLDREMLVCIPTWNFGNKIFSLQSIYNNIFVLCIGSTPAKGRATTKKTS